MKKLTLLAALVAFSSASFATTTTGTLKFGLDSDGDGHPGDPVPTVCAINVLDDFGTLVAKGTSDEPVDKAEFTVHSNAASNMLVITTEDNTSSFLIDSVDDAEITYVVKADDNSVSGDQGTAPELPLAQAKVGYEVYAKSSKTVSEYKKDSNPVAISIVECRAGTIVSGDQDGAND